MRTERGMEQIKEIIAQHEEWVKTDGKQGTRADLSDGDFTQFVDGRPALQGAVASDAESGVPGR